MTIENMLQRPGTYPEERLAILILLDQVDEENRCLREANSVLKETQAKQKGDLNEAHSRIRELKLQLGKLGEQVTRLEIRAGYIAAGCGAVVAALAELAKWLLHHS